MASLSNDKELQDLYRSFQDTRSKIVERLRSHGRPLTSEYVFSEGARTDVTLSEAFGDRQDLLVIHNMGKSCRYCTLWADGINGLLPHLESRTAIVLVSPNDPATQREFADSRGWNLRMLNDATGSFTNDLHFAVEENGKRFVMPGVSAFHRSDDGSIAHIASDFFGPGDTYMPAFPLFELLKDGTSDWQPQYAYPKPVSIDLPEHSE